MDYYPIQSPGQLSAHLRALREARGLSQAQLGAALGVGQTRIARIERKPTVVSVGQLLNLLGALEMQMVLRPTTPVTSATAVLRDSGAARRGAVDEPW
jgi:HTH-type transcriptional regulator / antitoxin HipB